MTPATIGVIGIVVLVLLLFSKMPVGFVMALVGVVGFGILVSFNAAFNLVVKDIFSVFGSYSLTVIPLFILMGQIAFHSGISSRLFTVAYKFIGHWPGGLAIATIGACTGFAAICGSTNATAATMAAVTLPEMKRYRYDDKIATGVVAAGGSLGILVPPSVIFIIYGVMTEQSIGKLFMAGILPGLLLSLLFSLAVIIWTHLKPTIAPRGPKVSIREKIASLSGLGETILLFLLVMGGLFFGIFTPTEAGAVGAFGTLVIAVIRRKLTLRDFIQSLFETTGCFIDALALITLTVPIFYPVVSALGYDPVWFGVIIVLVTQIGVVTPPVGVNVYVVKGIAKEVPLYTIFRGVVPLLIALIVGTFLMIPFPQIALFLPGLMK